MKDLKNGAISEEALNKVAGGLNPDEALNKVASSLNIDRAKLEKGLKIAGVAVVSTAAVAGAGVAIGVGVKNYKENKAQEEWSLTPKEWATGGKNK